MKHKYHQAKIPPSKNTTKQKYQQAKIPPDNEAKYSQAK